jgi:hypothetical protein
LLVVMIGTIWPVLSAFTLAFRLAIWKGVRLGGITLAAWRSLPISIAAQCSQLIWTMSMTR